MKRILGVLTALVMVFGLTATANASLIVRGWGTSVHGIYQLIYDDDLNITWYDYTHPWDTWWNQVNWADALEVTMPDGTIYDDWRLPITTQPDPSCSYQLDPDPGGGFPLLGWGYNCTGSGDGASLLHGTGQFRLSGQHGTI